MSEENGWPTGHPVATRGCGSEADPSSSGRGWLLLRDSDPGTTEGGRGEEEQTDRQGGRRG